MLESDFCGEIFNMLVLFGDMGVGVVLIDVVFVIGCVNYFGGNVFVVGMIDIEYLMVVVVVVLLKLMLIDFGKDWFCVCGENNVYLLWWGCCYDVCLVL